MVFWAVVAAALAVWLVRLLLAKRALRSFCGTDCLTLAVKVPSRHKGWKHGYARLTDDAIEWRGEYKFGAGADLVLGRRDLDVRDHRPVVRGEAMLSDRCELVTARHGGEEIQLAVVKTDLDRLVDWAR